ncbi:hypothetical protein HYPSUDRAFT_200295 [Hypholoma sublateritium FD-334 SS-4]|uniref:Uncharacterized protein n=1 Tax=Hypholoma sublateritium (strain FD-334 SS-4) TaxID=945553 RepID=A0A0D2P1H5_HYPSF|nr:hypothetical protein HYPSUDRAFT_200295 [Hypholoma sublateritium FD-334 SS-4]
MDQYTTFCRPAPNLESFGIVDDLSGYITLVNLLTSLFNGNALMLHDFCLMGPRDDLAALARPSVFRKKGKLAITSTDDDGELTCFAIAAATDGGTARSGTR